MRDQAVIQQIDRQFRFQWAVTLRPITAFNNRNGLQTITDRFLRMLDKAIFPHGQSTLNALAIVEDGDHIHIGIGGIPINKNDADIHQKMVKVAGKITAIWNEHNIADSKRFSRLALSSDTYNWTGYILKNMGNDNDKILHYGPVRKHETALDKWFDSPSDSRIFG